jgi:hypothetical protein
VEGLLSEVSVIEIQRASLADEACRELGLPLGSTLESLAAAAQPPWTGVFLDHRQVLVTLTGELSRLAEANQHLMAAGMKAVENTLDQLGYAERGQAEGYDARGRRGLNTPNTWAVVDRTL